MICNIQPVKTGLNAYSIYQLNDNIQHHVFRDKIQNNSKSSPLGMMYDLQNDLLFSSTAISIT